jgi:hypothetical protein
VGASTPTFLVVSGVSTFNSRVEIGAGITVTSGGLLLIVEFNF